MIPGKIFYDLMPKVTFGTHCSLNRLAYFALRRALPETSFPRLHTINHFEGLNGVDGLWLNNRHMPSRSTYNPVTGEGSGLVEFTRQFKALQEAIQNNRKRRIARRMAHIAHITTDVCTPPHQHGQLIPPRRKRFLFWRVKDDWYERYHETYVVDRHFLFELRVFFAVVRQPLPPISVALEWKAEEIRAHVRQNIQFIRNLNLYERYIREGWTEAIQQQFNREVFPRIATMIATIWYLALISVRTV